MALILLFINLLIYDVLSQLYFPSSLFTMIIVLYKINYKFNGTHTTFNTFFMHFTSIFFFFFSRVHSYHSSKSCSDQTDY